MIGKRQLRTAELGTVPPTSTLHFDIPAANGFTVNALLECDMKLVASWESVEIAGGRTEEELIPPGQYTLQISIVYTKTQATPVNIEVGVSGAGVEASKKLSFEGKKKDIGRAVAFVAIA